MELNNEFRVSVPVEQAWEVLSDVERIAPCMPGAELQEVEGDEYRGVVKIKVGPITAQYKGKATFQERDETARRMVLKAEGRDTRGAGNASATITATMSPDGDATKVQVHTDLTVTGKVAQFGRGVLGDVSAKLLDQFVACLEDTVIGAAPAPQPADVPEPEPSPTRVNDTAGATYAGKPSEAAPVAPRPTAAPVDLLDVAGGSVAKRVLPLAGILAVVLLLLRRRRRG